MKNKLKKIKWVNALRATFVIAILTVLFSCDKEKELVTPTYPPVETITLVDFLGIYTLTEDRCSEEFFKYNVSIIKKTSEEGENQVMIVNFGNQTQAPLLAELNKGRLEIPYQQRFVNGHLKEVAGYIYKKKGGIRIVLYSYLSAHNYETPGLCEMYAAKVK